MLYPTFNRCVSLATEPRQRENTGGEGQVKSLKPFYTGPPPKLFFYVRNFKTFFRDLDHGFTETHTYRIEVD